MRSIITKSAKETQKIAADLAKKSLAGKPRRALILALSGELGSGKTTFIKGFSKTLGGREKVLSPTFVLIHRHKIKKSFKFQVSSFKNFYHIDAYRLESEKDLLKIGAKELFSSPDNSVMIEWADRVKKIIPKKAAWIRFKHSGKNKREIKIKWRN